MVLEVYRCFVRAASELEQQMTSRSGMGEDDQMLVRWFGFGMVWLIGGFVSCSLSELCGEDSTRKNIEIFLALPRVVAMKT